MVLVIEEPYTPEEQKYEYRLIKLASDLLGDQWQEHWPTNSGRNRTSYLSGYINTYGPIYLAKSLVRRPKEERNGSSTLCIAECPPLQWCVRLGLGWVIDPQFFIDHFRPPDCSESLLSVDDSHFPASDKGFQSPRHDASWVTMRGYVNRGMPNKSLADYDFPNTTNRIHGLSHGGERLVQTSMSVYKAREPMYTVLFDQVPDWSHKFSLRNHGGYPYQTIARHSGQGTPYHFAMPLLEWTDLTATPILHPYLDHDVTKSFLAEPLQTMDVNEFLYRACLLQTHKELWELGGDVYYLQMRQCRSCQGLENREMKLSDKGTAEAYLAALRRVKKCISEILAYERSPGRSDVFVTGAGMPSCNFATVMQRAEKHRILPRGGTSPMQSTNDDGKLHSAAEGDQEYSVTP